MQEVVLARHINLCFGQKTTSLEELRDIVNEVGPLCSTIQVFLWLTDLRSLPSDKMSTVITQLLNHSRIRSTTDPRDRVYGLLGVCSYAFGRDFLRPDYSLPPATVYKQLTTALIEKTGSLIFLNQVTPFYHTDPSIPSWVLDLGSGYDHLAEIDRLRLWEKYTASRNLRRPYCFRRLVVPCTAMESFLIGFLLSLKSAKFKMPPQSPPYTRCSGFAYCHGSANTMKSAG
jgi:hypothetical protein